ncbi:MAG: immunoglobulin domain-containing protein [Limisphaerales bacterium]
MKTLPLWCALTCGLFSASIVTAQSQSYTWTTIAAFPGTTTSTNEVVGPGIAVDSEGTLYVADSDNGTIQQIGLVGANWVVTTLGGTNSGVRFTCPSGITVDGAGKLYVTDTLANNTVRSAARVGTNWVVTTLAGLAGSWGKADGTNSNARFDTPIGIAVDGAENLFVADLANCIIRKVTPAGTNWVVSTIAGYGYPGNADGTNKSARFFSPYGVCTDGAGNLYVADQGNATIRKITPVGTNWVVSTIAGQALIRGAADGTNHNALFNSPCFIAVDNATNFYVADNWNNNIRKVSPAGTNWVVTTIGGLAGSAGNDDGAGSDARFNGPCGIAVDAAGNLYVTDFLNHTVRKGVPFAVATFPRSQGVPSGTSVCLSVTATSDNGPFTYQWLFDGVTLSGQTNATLPLGPVGRTNSGVYSVVVSNAAGNWTTLNATVRALVPPLIEAPQIASNATIRLLFRDADGGLPYDLSQVELQWRAELPSTTDTNWQTLTSACYPTNGYAAFDDTNGLSGSSRFYRLLER